MNEEQFLEILKENESIYDLIINHHVSILNNYGSLKNTSPEFIDWLSPQYYEAVTTLFKENLNTKTESKLVKLMNAPLYCNEVTKEKVIAFFSNICKQNIDQTRAIYVQLKGKSEDLGVILNSGAIKVLDGLEPVINPSGLKVLSPLNIAIFNNLNNHSIQDLKQEAIDLSLDFCEKIKKRSAKDWEFLIFEDFIKKLSKLNLSEEQQARLSSYAKKKNRKIIYAKAGGIIVIILIILRALSKINH